jgi:hypothetical protein
MQLKMVPDAHIKVQNKSMVMTRMSHKEMKERSCLRIWRKEVDSLLLQKHEDFQDVESTPFSRFFLYFVVN